MDYHEKLLIDCVREKTQKNDTITLSKLSRICGIDYRTVENHFRNIVGRDLGDGTKIKSREVLRSEYYRDPPGEGVNPLVWLSALFVGLAIIAVVRIARQPCSHVCSLVPVIDAGGQGYVCQSCGAQWYRSAPAFHPIADWDIGSHRTWTYSSTV